VVRDEPVPHSLASSEAFFFGQVQLVLLTAHEADLCVSFPVSDLFVKIGRIGKLHTRLGCAIGALLAGAQQDATLSWVNYVFRIYSKSLKLAFLASFNDLEYIYWDVEAGGFVAGA